MMKDGKLQINIFFYIFLNLFLVIGLNDYIYYFFKLNYIVGIIISIFAIGIINYLLRNRIKTYNSFSKTDLIFFFVLICLMVVTIPYADRSFDTVNYHLYLQENPFGNKLFYDFFVGRHLNSFSYALPDRVFYLFRYLLGYRLGVILNYFTMITIYYLAKDIILKLFGKISKDRAGLFALISVLSISLLDIIDSYYIDLFSIVFLLESFYIIFFTKNIIKKSKDNTFLYGYIGLLFGLTFAIKISNAPIVILLFLLFIINNPKFYKSLTLKNVFITLLMFLVPFILYLVYNVLTTGNPVFPFYNTIFKSEFFDNSNWLDKRFGPARLLEVPIWNIVAFLNPVRFVDQAICEPMWMFGYFIAIIFIFYNLYKKLTSKQINTNELKFMVFVVLLNIFWAKFQLGYSRYGLIVLVINGIALCYLFHKFLEKKSFFGICFISLLLLWNYNYSFIYFRTKDIDWIYSNAYNSSRENLDFNIKHIFDKGYANIAFPDKSSLVVLAANGSDAIFINNNMPIINIGDSVSNDYSRKILDENLSKYENLYSFSDSQTLQFFVKRLNDNGYKIVESYKTINFDNARKYSEFFYIFKVEKCKGVCTSTLSSFYEKQTFLTNGANKIIFNFGVHKDLNGYYKNDFNVRLSLNYSNGDTKSDIINVSKSGQLVTYVINDSDKVVSYSVEPLKENSEGYWLSMITNVEGNRDE